MEKREIRRIKTISEYHHLRGLPKPEHPLISLVDYSLLKHSPDINNVSWVNEFYLIALKRNLMAKFRYGQQAYDFDEGTMFFLSPGQVFRIEVEQDNPKKSGWMLLIHPDFIWDMPLAKTIGKYEFFGYTVSEALFLSEKEEDTILAIMKNILHEYHLNIDKFSQQIIVSQIELLLSYAERFYNRQFLTRKVANHQIIAQFEILLKEFFNGNNGRQGLPTVNYLSEKLNVSVDYLRSLLKVTTGQTTQQHIHEILIEKAKEKLSSTNLTVNEIAFELGFEHSQSFSKLFKAKTGQTPKEFRISYN